MVKKDHTEKHVHIPASSWRGRDNLSQQLNFNDVDHSTKLVYIKQPFFNDTSQSCC